VDADRRDDDELSWHQGECTILFMEAEFLHCVDWKEGSHQQVVLDEGRDEVSGIRQHADTLF